MTTDSFTAGIALPQSVLAEPWFIVFSLFVAFNTVIYLGLTLAKFIPWPAPVHPSSVRHLLPSSLETDLTMHIHPHNQRPLPQDFEQRLRVEAARETIPMALGLIGAIAILASLVNTVLYLDTDGPLSLAGAVIGLILIILAQILSHANVSDHTMLWVWGIAMLVMVSETAWRAATLDSTVVLVYATMAFIVIAPVSTSWRAGVIVVVIGFIPIAIAGSFVSGVNTGSWVIASITASFASLVLLRLRLVPIGRIADEHARAHSLTTNDSLTGCFSRIGLLALAPTIAQAAQRSNEQVFVTMCDVVGMNEINHDYGFTYGDDVLGATARAL